MTLAAQADLIDKSFREVLERMTFTDIETRPAYEESTFTAPEHYTSTIAFKGKVNGRLVINAPKCFARDTTASMLGKDEEDVSDAEMDDVMKELANMVIGNILSKMDKDASLATLDIPEIHTGKDTPPAEFPVTVFPFIYNSLSSDSEEEEFRILLELSWNCGKD